MTLEELLAESPELYLAILEEGRAQEINRALSHLDTARYYDAVAEAVETKRPPQVVEAKAHCYEQAAKRLAG